MTVAAEHVEPGARWRGKVPETADHVVNIIGRNAAGKLVIERLEGPPELPDAYLRQPLVLHDDEQLLAVFQPEAT